MAFETVTTEAVFRGSVRKERAWEIISDYTRYPAIMENVDRVEIAERSQEEGVSRWYITVEEAPLYWIEKDYFNKGRYEIAFESIEGDFDNINGSWRITDHPDEGIAIRFEIQYNLGIPVIEEVLGHILREKMKANIDRMMTAVKKELCGPEIDERKHARYPVCRPLECAYRGTPLSLFVRNLSAGGMMTGFAAALGGTGVMEIGSARLEIAAVHADEAADRCRIIFRDAVDDALLRELAALQTAAAQDRRAA